MTNRELLLNVVIIRVLLIVLLVLYHSFAIFNGAWEPINSYPPQIDLYWWLANLSYACLLESFVFISGYVFGYQARIKGQDYLSLKNVAKSKLKRLILPSIVFSLLYIIVFYDIRQPINETLFSLLNGVGHMWFLPMLFWCFMVTPVILKAKVSLKSIVIVLSQCALFSFVPLPFQISRSMYYLPFFFAGFIIQYRNFNIDFLYTRRICLTTLLSFVVVFPILLLSRNWILFLSGETLFHKVMISVWYNLT